MSTDCTWAGKARFIMRAFSQSLRLTFCCYYPRGSLSTRSRAQGAGRVPGNMQSLAERFGRLSYCRTSCKNCNVIFDAREELGFVPSKPMTTSAAAAVLFAVAPRAWATHASLFNPWKAWEFMCSELCKRWHTFAPVGGCCSKG